MNSDKCEIWLIKDISDNGIDNKFFMCKICGELYKLSDEDKHEATHSKVPPTNNNQKYYLSTSYREANSDINNGATFVPLLLNYYKSKFIETWYNAMLLPNNHKLTDYNNTAVKYNAITKEFIKTIFSFFIFILLI